MLNSQPPSPALVIANKWRAEAARRAIAIAATVARELGMRPR